MRGLFILIIILNISACEEIEVIPKCELEATVLDMSEIDGCRYVFQTDAGVKYEPTYTIGFCATGDYASGQAWTDPMRDFNLHHGQRIKFNFEELDMTTNCMMGTVIRVTCITEIERSADTTL